MQITSPFLGIRLIAEYNLDNEYTYFIDMYGNSVSCVSEVTPENRKKVAKELRRLATLIEKKS